MAASAPDYSAEVRTPTQAPSIATLHETLTSEPERCGLVEAPESEAMSYRFCMTKSRYNGVTRNAQLRKSSRLSGYQDTASRQ